jgi:hypothetical protein
VRSFSNKRSQRLNVLIRTVATIAIAGMICGVGWVSSAWAVIHPASILDGPANDILEVDGSAMAPDGSGAILYRKEDAGGVPHVYVVQFTNGQWGSPTRVDTENPYAATMPAIAAGNGGRLLVVWVQPRGVTPGGVTLYELMSASLQPGASSFGQAVAVDLNVGEPHNGDVSAVDPSLAMNPENGQAYVVYRVIDNDCSTTFGNDPPNSACSLGKLVEVRVARFNYLPWTSLGSINRAPELGMRNPTASNAPQVGIDVSGNGIVAWQEPTPTGVARIWVRRLFGTRLGNVLSASPEKIDGQPVVSDADEPVVAMSPFGAAEIVYRIQGATGSVVPTTQLFYNSIASEFSPKASQLSAAAPITNAGGLGAGGPSAAIDTKGQFRIAWPASGTVHELNGTEEVAGSPAAIGASPGEAEATPTTIDPSGGGTTAWPQAAGASTVEVRQDYTQGAFQLAQLTGNLPGPIAGMSLAGSGQGDALVGWSQGNVGDSEVVGDFVQAPPAQFDLDVPVGWVRSAGAGISWEPAADAVRGVTYTVYVDGSALMKGLTGLSAQLSSARLGDGTHHVQVLAVDASGGQTMSQSLPLEIDANPPTVKLRLIDRRRGVSVTVRDRASGVDAHATSISFGDGSHSKGKALATHLYGTAGTYAIAVQVRDKAGNHATVRLRVSVE